jgi:hypothetical protein
MARPEAHNCLSSWGLRLIDLPAPAAYDGKYQTRNGKIHFL